MLAFATKGGVIFGVPMLYILHFCLQRGDFNVPFCLRNFFSQHQIFSVAFTDTQTFLLKLGCYKQFLGFY